MFKKILVPVDGSETSWRALNNALEIGRKFNSEIVVVNVIQPYNNAALLAVPRLTTVLSAAATANWNASATKCLNTLKTSLAIIRMK